MDTGEKEEYFTSYEDLEVHELMLDDVYRTSAYRNAIFFETDSFKDKVVMDVGCGTGILSVFCAQAGAKKVYAVEASDVANVAKDLVKENNFENIIEVIHSKVEDVSLPDNEKVDIIVSEWMGFYLLHEGMLDSVLFARDKFLKEGGRMFPESASMGAAPCSIPPSYKKWEKTYGVSMSSFDKHLRQSKRSKPQIQIVHEDDVLSESETFCWMDLKDINVSDLDSISKDILVVARKPGTYQAIAIWFAVFFSNNDRISSIEMETGPHHPATHWKQTVVVLPQEYDVEKDEPIAFRITLNRDQSCRRRYNIEVTMLDPEQVEHPLPCDCYLTKCIIMKAFLNEHPERENIDNTEKELTTIRASQNGVLEDEPIED